MTQNKGFFRNAFDALVESRTREAARQVAQYRHILEGEPRVKVKR